MRRQQWKRRGWRTLKAGRVLEKPVSKMKVLGFGCSFERDMRFAFGRLGDALAKSAAALETFMEQAFGILGEKGRAAFDDIYSASLTW